MKDLMLQQAPGPIGIFDSGYGGLTIFAQIQKLMPQYDFMYLGDNARTPYGTRSFQVVYDFTQQAVRYLFESGCHLVVLACNTASAKALRTIQQNDVPQIDPNRRVLGIIRPTVECIGDITKSRHIGLLATEGTVKSMSYPLEIKKLFPDVEIVSEACPMWVPLVENNELNSPAVDYFVQRHVERLLAKDEQIDTLILGCTHYPMLLKTIKKFVPKNIQIVTQGEYVAKSLVDYLQRHPAMDDLCTKNGKARFCSTESEEKFKECASIFLHHKIKAETVSLG